MISIIQMVVILNNIKQRLLVSWQEHIKGFAIDNIHTYAHSFPFYVSLVVRTRGFV